MRYGGRRLERGLRFKQIARDLSISEPTAKGYARDMFRKLVARLAGRGRA